jgi:hypothetical protein
LSSTTRKISRTLAALAFTAAPFVLMSGTSAYAAEGCAVDNANPTSNSSVSVEVVVDVTQVPPVTITLNRDSTSVWCSYVSDGPAVAYNCTLAGGRCTVYVNGVSARTCTLIANTTCHGTYPVSAGDRNTLEALGGSGSDTDVVA